MAALVDQPGFFQYLGFENKETFREYSFSLRGLAGQSSNYFVAIPNEAFSSHRVRYQDGPAICSIRLRREFASQIDHPACSTFLVSDQELAEYREAHSPKISGVPWKSPKDEDF